MKTHIKKVLILAKEGKKEEAEKLIPTTYKIIDTAAKKNILHKNNAARKKSRLARTVANIKEVSSAPAAPAKKAPAKAKKEENTTEDKA